MHLTRMTDYALRLLIYVARHPDRLCTIAEIASVHRISRPHLMKITHQLALHGWIETVRGRGGGLRLSRPAEEINLGAVVRSIEPDFHLVECFAAGNACTLTGDCGLAGILSGALREFMAHLDGRTLADAVRPPARSGRKWAPISGPRRRAS